MKISTHVYASAGASAAVYAMTRSISMTAACFLSGTAIDLDHVPYFLILSGEKATVENLFAWCEGTKWTRIFLLLHSHEIYLLLACFAYLANNPVLWGIFIGGGLHLAMDQWGNKTTAQGQKFSPWFYFLTFRAAAGFKREGMTIRVAPAGQ